MQRSEKILLSAVFPILVIGSCFDFFNIAWGTGVWFGEMSRTWVALFGVFCLAGLAALFFLLRTIWDDRVLERISATIGDLRAALAWKRWVLGAVIFALPVWLLQFTVYGIVFHGLFLRLTLWVAELVILAILFTSKDSLLDLKVLLMLLMLTSGAFSIFASMSLVTDYPFSLGWSEGNRLWDYSILFDRERYDYPANQPIEVYLDIGRRVVGGIPFLIPGITIELVRMWIALMSILPYIFLGLAAFRFSVREKHIYVAAVLWTYLFLKQGPIHPTLVLYAVLVILAWRSKIWLSIPLIVIASYFARLSRITWMFAPVIWFFQLSLLDNAYEVLKELRETRKLQPKPLSVLAVLGVLVMLAGITGYYRLDGVSDILSTFLISPEFVKQTISQQPLLWYRLLPNETYGSGILVGLAIATLPLMFILIYLLRSRNWVLNNLQQWVLELSLLTFLAVGLIISVKIGGGGDLHNMDMFLIGLYFVAVVAFYNRGGSWLQRDAGNSLWVCVALILLFAIPGLGPLQEIRSYDYMEADSRLLALTGAASARQLKLYPSDEIVNESLATIQEEVGLAQTSGEVLFVDQRQLLTFGFVQNVSLVPEYDKKVLIENAMSGNTGYFRGFYEDLERERFSLILLQPLNTAEKGDEYSFGEEGAAWAEWVTKPLLCFYEIRETLRDVNIQLLIPRMPRRDCTNVLP